MCIQKTSEEVTLTNDTKHDQQLRPLSKNNKQSKLLWNRGGYLCAEYDCKNAWILPVHGIQKV